MWKVCHQQEETALCPGDRCTLDESHRSPYAYLVLTCSKVLIGFDGWSQQNVGAQIEQSGQTSARHGAGNYSNTC
jgi:hypothetical protein